VEVSGNKKGGSGMTGSDLIVLAPWVVFGAAIGAICARLYVSRSRARRRRALRRPERDRPGAAA